MRVGETYDLIVIGDQLSGLFLAAGAAQRGMKVLVLEESNFPTVLYEAPSGRLLGDFLAEPAVGLAEGSRVDSFLKSIGLYQELDQLFRRHEPSLQILARGFRLDCPYEPTAFRAALEREVSLGAPELAQLRRLLGAEAASKKPFARVVADLGLPVAFEALGPLQAALYGSYLPRELSYSDYRELWALCARGVRFPVGGRGALKERLLSRLQVFGGSLRRASHVEELVFEKGRLAGVLLSSYEGFVRSKRVVGAMAANTFARLVPSELRSRRLESAVASVAPRGWKLGFTLLVPEAVVPEGMGSHVAILDSFSSLEAGGLVQLQIFPKDFYGGIPAKHVAILGRIILPFAEATLRPRAIATQLKRALQRVEDVVPFLRDRSFSMFPDPDNLEKDPVFQRYYNFPRLSYIPGSLLVYESAFGAGSRPNEVLDWVNFGLNGLALCSRDIRPLQGVYGEIVSAMDLLESWDRRKLRRTDSPRPEAR
jgi:glycine/D-amino acid oxidase-like deaminating enzyme